MGAKNFPSLKGSQLLAILQREPLGYVVDKQRGSHRLMSSKARGNTLKFSFHEGATVGAGAVRKVLVDDVGLTEAEARLLLRKGKLQ